MQTAINSLDDVVIGYVTKAIEISELRIRRLPKHKCDTNSMEFLADANNFYVSVSSGKKDEVTDDIAGYLIKRSWDVIISEYNNKDNNRGFLGFVSRGFRSLAIVSGLSSVLSYINERPGVGSLFLVGTVAGYLVYEVIRFNAVSEVIGKECAVLVNNKKLLEDKTKCIDALYKRYAEIKNTLDKTQI